MAETSTDSALRHTREDIIKSIQADITKLDDALKDEPPDTGLDGLLAIAVTTSRFVPKLHSEFAIRSTEVSEKHEVTMKPFYGKSMVFEVESTRHHNIREERRHEDEARSNRANTDGSRNTEDFDGSQLRNGEDTLDKDDDQSIVKRETPPNPIHAEDIYGASPGMSSPRMSSPLTLEADDAPENATPPQVQSYTDHVSYSEAREPCSTISSPAPPVIPKPAELYSQKRAVPLAELEMPPAKAAKKETTQVMQTYFLHRVESLIPTVRIYYDHERADIPINHRDQPEYIEVPEKWLFKYMSLIQTLFERKRSKNAKFDLDDAICWDVTASKSAKPFSAPRAVYVKDLIQGTKKDTTELKYFANRERWVAVKVFCNWLLGKDIVLGEYTWKGEQVRAVKLAKWLGVSKRFLAELEVFREEQYEFVFEE